MQLHWAVEPEDLESKWLVFQNLVPEDLILYGQDYMARDMRSRIRDHKALTHPRYKTYNKYLN